MNFAWSGLGGLVRGRGLNAPRVQSSRSPRALHPVHAGVADVVDDLPGRGVDVPVQDALGRWRSTQSRSPSKPTCAGSSGSSLTPSGGQWQMSTSARRQLARELGRLLLRVLVRPAAAVAHAALEPGDRTARARRRRPCRSSTSSSSSSSSGSWLPCTPTRGIAQPSSDSIHARSRSPSSTTASTCSSLAISAGSSGGRLSASASTRISPAQLLDRRGEDLGVTVDVGLARGAATSGPCCGTASSARRG